MESNASRPQSRGSAGGPQRARAAKQSQGGGRWAGAEFNLTETQVCAWGPTAERDGGTGSAGGPDGGLSSAQRAEAARLRQENSRLRQEIEVLRRGYRN